MKFKRQIFERQRKIAIPTSISGGIWSFKIRGRVENVHFSLQLLNKYQNIRCTFINTVSCDEQRGLYRIVLTYVSDDLEAFC